MLQDADGLQLAIDSMKKLIGDTEFDVIAGTESRGFIFGVPIAYSMHKAFVPVRKKENCPGRRYPKRMIWSTAVRP